ncbi:hypothetical protein JBL43_20160, partial [Aureibaculum sp. A20]|nr:hypothetical protein [Aureibaculum flavum]
ITVDDVTYSTNNWTNIDPQTSFSEDCSAIPLTYVPDDNFEQALIDLGYDSGALDDYVPTANINSITALDVSSKNIADLTGIEDFVAITSLNCSFNNLSALDVSNNILLEVLECVKNNFTSIDVSNNTALTSLNIVLNELTALDVSNNTQLRTLNTSTNFLTSLDVSNNVLLESLYCDYNPLTSLNVKNGNNTNINVFHADNNPSLNCIEVDDVAYSNNTWTNIDPQTSFSEDCSDTTAPIITLLGDNPQIINLDDGYTEIGADTDDGSTVVIDATAFVDAVGSYTIYYNA